MGFNMIWGMVKGQLKPPISGLTYLLPKSTMAKTLNQHLGSQAFEKIYGGSLPEGVVRDVAHISQQSLMNIFFRHIFVSPYRNQHISLSITYASLSYNIPLIIFIPCCCIILYHIMTGGFGNIFEYGVLARSRTRNGGQYVRTIVNVRVRG